MSTVRPATTPEPPPPRLSPEEDLVLGFPGFSYGDLHDPRRLGDLLDLFEGELGRAEPELLPRYRAWRSSAGTSLGPVQTSELLVAVAPHVSRFFGELFRIRPALDELREKVRGQEVVFRFKREFLQRRAFQRLKSEGGLQGERYAELDAGVRSLFRAAFPELDFESDPEWATATAVMTFYDLDKAFRAAPGVGPDGEAAGGRPEAFDQVWRGLQGSAAAKAALMALTGLSPEDAEAPDAAAVLKAVLDLLERWAAVRALDPEGRAEVRSWPSYQRPEQVDHQRLVELRRPAEGFAGRLSGLPERLRRRDGFKLTDRRMGEREALSEMHYCIYCHDRDKDSCSKGLRAPKDGSLKKNPLGVELGGCPLREKISEGHWLKLAGDPLAALALICVDNPMAPGTGHRICNDCMKSCIYQKQEPVNIPQVETGILTDVLGLPWGFEIWSLLTRFNPLNARRPVALPYNGKNVLVVGLGPAGYTLAHYLLNEGFGVVGIDGLKIEPLPSELVGGEGRPPRPLRAVDELVVELDQRVLAGFGGVSEYGITVRWDKNFLTLLYLNLVRRRTARLYGGVRFGGTLGVEDVWELGFDHVAIAAGAGKPTVLGMKNDLLRGIRTASDFLMALQLTGAFKRNALANFQVQLPALVIGGGLTAIDTATELMAYYPLQVEKVLERHEQLEAAMGAERLGASYDEEECEILATFLEHGRAVRAERERAAQAGEAPDFVELVRAWGGVSIVYRKAMVDSPAYRLNHEEIGKALEEGIYFIEGLSPVEAIPGPHGAVGAIAFERMAQVEGRWVGTGEHVELPARTVCVAAGTSPNVVYEREHPGTFELDQRRQFFRGFRPVRQNGHWDLVPAQGAGGFFTSYAKDGKFVSYYGDNHPAYAGNVVKAMASAKDGYPQVVQLFEEEVGGLDPEAEPERLERFRVLTESLDHSLRARVVEVRRLTPTIVEVVVRAPLAARQFRPGQFYRLQNYEVNAPEVLGTRLMTEGIALTGAWVEPEHGLLSLIVLEVGASSRLVATLRPGEDVIVMGPTGTPTEIPRGETVLLAGGGLGNAVLFSIARALRDHGNQVLYFAGYKRREDLFKRDEIEAGADHVIWSVDLGETIQPRRACDRTFRGNLVQAMLAYAEGRLGGPPMPSLRSVDRIIAIGSDRMMAAVQAARKQVLAPYLRAAHVGIGSINSTMQCMMKEVCGQCLQKHVDPATGAESFVFSCFNQDQPLDRVDFGQLNERLKTNSVLEKLANHWLDHLLEVGELRRV
jgi:NADPH-dependent glutamate synthase beta subunit-like oxidoreductase/NAD(P)H-flavin reductase